MYAPAQSANAGRAHYPIVDWQTLMEQVTVVTLAEINQDMPSPYARGVVSAHDPTRFQGGNW